MCFISYDEPRPAHLILRRLVSTKSSQSTENLVHVLLILFNHFQAQYSNSEWACSFVQSSRSLAVGDSTEGEEDEKRMTSTMC